MKPIVPLVELAEIEMGTSPPSEFYNTQGKGDPLINGPTEFTDRHPVAIQWTTQATRFCRPGDILICVRGSSTGRMNIANRRYAIGRGVAAIRARTGKGDTDFIQQALEYQTSKLLELTAGSTFPSIDRRSIGAIAVGNFTLNEQKAIAAVLSTWDRGIRQLSDLIAAKLRFKQGLMQQLLTGKRRFNGFCDEWQTVHLKDVTEECEERNRGRLSTDSVMAVTKAEGIVPMRERTIAADIDRYSVVKKDYFAYNPMRLNIGSIARWSGENDVLVSPDYVVFHCKKPDDDEHAIDTNYLDQYRRSSLWERYVTSSGNGSVRVRIYFDDLGGMKLKLPSLKEQQRIAAVLNTADCEIEILRRELDALKTQKKGLMQKLLTGQVRVPASGGRQSPVSDSREGKS